jgi:hypothetical protein
MIKWVSNSSFSAFIFIKIFKFIFHKNCEKMPPRRYILNEGQYAIVKCVSSKRITIAEVSYSGYRDGGNYADLDIQVYS